LTQFGSFESERTFHRKLSLLNENNNNNNNNTYGNSPKCYISILKITHSVDERKIVQFRKRNLREISRTQILSQLHRKFQDIHDVDFHKKLMVGNFYFDAYEVCTHTFSLSFFITLILSPFFLSPSNTYTHWHSSLSLSLCISPAHTLTRTHKQLSLYHTHTLSLSYPYVHKLTIFLSITHTLFFSRFSGSMPLFSKTMVVSLLIPISSFSLSFSTRALLLVEVDQSWLRL